MTSKWAQGRERNRKGNRFIKSGTSAESLRLWGDYSEEIDRCPLCGREPDEETEGQTMVAYEGLCSDCHLAETARLSELGYTNYSTSIIEESSLQWPHDLKCLKDE